MASSASTFLVRKAAELLSHKWMSCEELGKSLYGDPGDSRNRRMSIMVRARRPINRMRKLGVLAMRPGVNGSAEYTLLPDCEGIML